MHRILKIAIALIVGLPVAAVAVFWLVGTSAEKTADATDIRPSQNLQVLGREYRVSFPNIININCNSTRYEFRERIWDRPTKLLLSLSFNSLVDEASSAEAAAINFKRIGDQGMALVATKDAFQRWHRVWEVKDDMNCYDLHARRASY